MSVGFPFVNPRLGSIKLEFVCLIARHKPIAGERQLNKYLYQVALESFKPSELIELRRTLTELNDAVTQIARSGNLEQANRVRDLLARVKREIYKLLAEQ